MRASKTEGSVHRNGHAKVDIYIYIYILIYIYIQIYIRLIFGPPFGPWTPGPILVDVAIFVEYVWKSVFEETRLLVHVSEKILQRI